MSVPSERGEELLVEGIRAAVRTGMESPYRQAIIEEIGDVDGELLNTESVEDPNEAGSRRRLARGVAAFVVTLVLIYALIRWRES